MASGKSLIGSKLSESIGYLFIDLDNYIEEQEQKSISEIFKSKGELYFRKRERFYLNELLNKDEKLIISTGGGTPCYYDTMEFIKNAENRIAVYLKVALQVLVKRLSKEKEKRPLVAHLKTDEALVEFIGKHLFERNQYYTQAHLIIDANENVDTIIEKIVLELF